MAKRISFEQYTACHKHRVNECKRDSRKSVIIFDEQHFPWCVYHFPADRKTNLGTTPEELFGKAEWKKRKSA